MLLLLTYIFFALGISFVCSILEAVLLSVSVYQLMPLADAGNGGAARMITLKRERADDAITSILVLNTIAHTIGATLAGAQASVVFGSQWVGAFSGVLTFLILVGTEIIPKTAGHTHALRLSGLAALVIEFLIKLLKPIVWMSRLLTQLISSGNEEGQVDRQQLGAMIAAARQQGVLKREEWKRLANLLTLEEVKVSDAMTPRTVLVTLPAESSISDLLNASDTMSFSRIPLYGPSGRDELVGYIFTREVFRAAAGGMDPNTPLKQLMRELIFVEEKVSIREMLEQLLEQREPMAVVLDKFGGVAGLVTMEDVVETILGDEIHEDTDQVMDLREFALRKRDQRLEALRKQGRILEQTTSDEDEDEDEDTERDEGES